MDKRTNLFGRGRSAIYVTVGTALVALGSGGFLSPFNIVAGGMSGIAIALDSLIDAPLITVDLLVGVLSGFFFVLGFFVFGSRFAIKTLLSTLLYPPLFYLSGKLSSPQFMFGYFDLGSNAYTELAVSLSAIIGGALVGAGCAISILGGGSSGGVDVLALTVSKMFPSVKNSNAMFIIDAAVILFGAVAVGDFVITSLGILSAAVCAAVFDRVLLLGGRGMIAHIITDKPNDIRQRIIESLQRTTTELDCVGGYTRTEKTLIIVSVSQRELGSLITIVRSADSSAFMTVHHASEIRGEGWRSLR